MKTLRDLTRLTAWLAASTPLAGLAEWESHEVRQLNGAAAQLRLPAKFQIVTESWNRVVAVPYMVNMPEKDRLLMLVGCDYPHRAFVLTSDNRGETWTDPRAYIRFSTDEGKTWSKSIKLPQWRGAVRQRCPH